jgi:predicted O-methyltransferase YrrM
MLYFLMRLRRPECVVETGVAAGYSSQVFLSAMESNGRGHLFSSDFPYYYLKDPEQYIGLLVEKQLFWRWDLLLEGDEANLPTIMSRVSKVDIFHFDSDKSYSGRVFALAQVTPKMADGGLIVIDDIQDNSHCFDYLKDNNILNFSVFEFLGKYVCLIGNL